MTCAICDAQGAEWVHRLDPAKSYFTEWGKQHVWADQVELCDGCEDLYRAGNDDELVRRRVGDREASPDEVEETARKPLQAFRRADQGAARLDAVLPPGAAELRAAGFTPVELLTGDHDIVHAWPADHRRSVPETRADRIDSAVDGQFWLVRSPWPSMDVREVLNRLWPWVHARDPAAHRHLELVREFLALDQATVEAMRAGEEEA